jgi:hypothetical protein
MSGNRPTCRATTTCWSRRRPWTRTKCATTTATRWPIHPTSGSATDNESLDDKQAAEVPDDSPDRQPSMDSHDSDHGVTLGLVSEEDLDQIAPAEHGSSSGQIDGTPEDGDSFFTVTE